MNWSLISPQGYKHTDKTSKSGMYSFVGRWGFNCCPPLFYQDAFQEEYYRTGTYPAVPIVPPRRPWTLLNWLFWALLLLYPLFKLLINMINSGSSLTLASFGFVIVMGEFSQARSFFLQNSWLDLLILTKPLWLNVWLVNSTDHGKLYPLLSGTG